MKDSGNYVSDPYINQWNSMYPGKQYPTPQKYPHMYSHADKTKIEDQVINPMFPDCHSQTCPKGIIDYQCQYKHSCWLKIGQLVFYSFMTFLVFIILIGLLAKIMRLVYSFLSSIFLLTRVISCMNDCLNLLSFGMFDKNLVVEFKNGKNGEVQRQRIISARNKQVAQRLEQLGFEVNFQKIDQFHIQKIQNIFLDYEIGTS